MTVYLLLVLWLSPEGKLDVKHIGTFGGKKNCIEEAKRVRSLGPPKGTKFHCTLTKHTKGIML